VIAVHEHTLPGGESRFYEILASPLKNPSGGLEAVKETSRDITDRVGMERQRADFLAMVTHDLKSPLTVIMGYAEMMLDKGVHLDDPQAADMLGGIYNSSKKLYGLVEDFLALSRLEKPGAAPKFGMTDVVGLLREAAHEAEGLAVNAGLRISMKIGSLPNALLDRRLVQRAIWNLLENAIKFTPSGGSVALKSKTARIGDADYLVISVSDTGIGITQQEKEKIFHKYYRSSKTAGIKGTGLGLAIVKAVAEAHSGRVEIESKPGNGSVFSLILPLRNDPQEDVA